LPQIKNLIEVNKDSILAKRAYKECFGQYFYITNGLEELRNPNFWNELIRIYLIEFHAYANVFNLKYFDTSTVPQSLLIAIYCAGYDHRKQKTKELTEYMLHLAKKNIKRIIFKPSISNAQALLIHAHTIFYHLKDIESRALLLHLNRICYNLGIHIDTNRFCDSANFNRKALFTKVLISSNWLTGSIYKAFNNFETRVDDLEYTTHCSSWQLLSKQVARKLNFQDDEAILISKLAVLNNRCADISAKLVIFPTYFQGDNYKIEEFCMNRHRELTKIHSVVIEELEVLKLKYSHCLNTIKINQELLSTFYSIISLRIFGFERASTKMISHKLICKIKYLCFQILKTAEKASYNLTLTSFYYHASFTLMSMIDHLDCEQKKELTRLLKLLSTKLLTKMENQDIFNYLIFKFGEKAINNKLI
jgi:hypothetical protein